MGDQQLGWAPPPEGATLARAALLTGGAAPSGPARDAAIRHLALGDGATHSHLVLDPVWKSHTTVLVSEAGAYPKARPRK